MGTVPKFQFSPHGPVSPEATDVLAAVEEQWNAAFGGQLNLDPTTPQGQLIASLAAIIADKNDQLLAVVNNFNPDTASGVYQDALARIYFLDRQPATRTAVICQCTGLVGTTIPAGALAQSTAGDKFQCVSGGVIPVGGVASLAFEAVETGPVPALAGSVTKIYQVIPGWDTVTNADAGAVGQDVETRAAFEERRRASVAKNATGSVAAVYANVGALDDVLDLVVRENVTASNASIGSVVLKPHSLYVCVAGGDDNEIATAILTRKSAGCDTTGNTPVTVVSTYGATYEINFQRPDALSFAFEVDISATADTPADVESLVRSAIVEAFNGGDGGSRARIGSTVFASRFYAPVASVSGGPIIRLQLAAPAGGTVGNSVDVGIDQLPTLDPANITVVVS